MPPTKNIDIAHNEVDDIQLHQPLSNILDIVPCDGCENPFVEPPLKKKKRTKPPSSPLHNLASESSVISSSSSLPLSNAAPLLHLPPISSLLLNNIEKSASALYRSRRAVIITGAGISVNAGIPDFRSDQGIYAYLKQKYPKHIMKGADLFDASLFRNETTTQLFYSFIAELKKKTLKAKETHTHRFLKSLHEQGKLLRCYSQNIDGLEFPGSAPPHPLVPLHGTLANVFCSVCQRQFPFNEAYMETYHQGDAPLCPHCLEIEETRQRNQQRGRTMGLLRPAIVLYNEIHPQGDWIAECVEKDVHKKPDLLLVMGTSLKVHGVKRLVRDLAHAVHQQKNGLVILVNRTALPQKEWENVFDMIFTEDVDMMVKRWSAWMQTYQQRALHKKSLASKRHFVPSQKSPQTHSYMDLPNSKENMEPRSHTSVESENTASTLTISSSGSKKRLSGCIKDFNFLNVKSSDSPLSVLKKPLLRSSFEKENFKKRGVY